MNSLFLRCLGILMLLVWAATTALAQVSLKTKQYLLLSGPENTASHQFAEDLAEIWSMPGVSFGSDLQPVSVMDGATRLERMRDQRGHLAIINGQEAWQLLPEHPQVKVVSVLWPNVLYGIRYKPWKSLELGTNSHLFHCCRRQIGSPRKKLFRLLKGSKKMFFSVGVAIPFRRFEHC